MKDAFFQFFSEGSIFWFCAMIGSGLFLLQFLFTLLIGDSLENPQEGSVDFDAGNFKWLSKQAVAGFLMMFGWAGLACRKEFDASIPWTLVISVSVGLFAMFVSSLLFKGARKLKSTGTVFQIEKAIGKEATVYQRIPPEGIGKVTVLVQQFTHEIDAISHEAEEIPSFTQVQIIGQADDRTVIVAPIKK